MHQRKSPRATWYDYTSPGCYFVTICTKKRKHYFGEIKNGEMKLNPLGIYCDQEIKGTMVRRNHVKIDTYVIMPNHIHLLITIDEKHHVGTHGNASHDNGSNIKPDGRDTLPRVPTTIRAITTIPIQTIESLGSIVRNIKSRITKYANEHHTPFARQGRYHDRIVRDNRAYDCIAHYIRMNPKNRKKDCFSAPDA